MKYYPEDFENKLGFDQIRSKLINYCYGELGVEQVRAMQASHSFEIVELLLLQTDEFKSLIERGDAIPFKSYSGVNEFLNSIRIEGNFLEQDQFFEVIKVLQILFSL